MCWSEPIGPSRCLAPYSSQTRSRPHQPEEVVPTGKMKFVIWSWLEDLPAPECGCPWLPSSLNPLHFSLHTDLKGSQCLVFQCLDFIHLKSFLSLTFPEWFIFQDQSEHSTPCWLGGPTSVFSTLSGFCYFTSLGHPFLLLHKGMDLSLSLQYLQCPSQSLVPVGGPGNVWEHAFKCAQDRWFFSGYTQCTHESIIKHPPGSADSGRNRPCWFFNCYFHLFCGRYNFTLSY